MSGIKDQQNIDALRKRLYDRSVSSSQTKRHQLTSTPTDISRGWGDVRRPVVVVAPAPAYEPAPAPAVPENTHIMDETMLSPRKRSYRAIIMLASIGLFVLVALASSVYLFFGVNQISARNITITLSAPFAIAAGEKLPLQVSISNQNTVQIESATLILNYPAGTKTGNEEAKDLYEERIAIDNITPGEAVNIPVNVLMFGEENEEKEIKASIEYRVTGSNGTFFKDAEPVKIKINSSPLVLRVDSIEKVSSGQEIEIKITLQSNAAVVQRNILVSASFPNSFTFVKSDPEPSYGQNEWLIDEIEPESSKVITLHGEISGVANEVSEIQLQAGAPRTDNQFIMGSVLTKAKTSYTIERPFIDVEVAINQDTDGKAVINAGEEANVTIRVKNTLEETIYDMRVEVAPKGNLIRDNLLNVASGLYESSSKTIRYEVSGMSSLEEVKPGETRDFQFSVKADPKQTTGSFDISTNVFARRVGESSVEEKIVGTALAEAKYSSEIKVDAQVGYSDGQFADTGAIPPVAGKATTYTITFAVEAGVNDVSGTVMTTTLPQYVSWLDQTAGEGTVEYNPVAKQLRWSVGDMKAKTTKQLQVQVSLLPSVTQVGTTPVIVGNQELRANDSFTEVSLRAQGSALVSELSSEAGFGRDNGEVQESDSNE